jgi:hypothetical protein
MTWRTGVDIGAFDRIGPWALPMPAKAEAGRQYVLDGLQRLSTLYVTLTPNKKPASFADAQEEREAKDDAPREMYVDLSATEPDVFDEDDEVETQGRVRRSILLTDVLDSRRLLKRQRAFADLPDADDLVERADRVAETLRNYKVPIVPFVSDDLEQVTRAFQLVNSQGTPMSQVHMVNALSWTQGFSLLDAFENLRRGPLAELGWDQLDETVLLRCFAVAVGLDSYGFKVQDLAEKLRQRKDAPERVATSLRVVASVLRQVCHIRSPELVPYTTQIVVLFGALSSIERLSKTQRDLVRDWVWYTSYAEAFGGSTSASMVGRATERLRAALDGERFIWEHRKAQMRRFPPQVDFRHGRAKVFALRLAQHRAKLDGLWIYRLLAREGAAALPNVLPSSGEKGAWKGGRGARVLVARDELATLRSALFGEYSLDLGKRHLISEEAWTAYSQERFEEFVKLRDADLERLESKHFGAVRRRLLGS